MSTSYTFILDGKINTSNIEKSFKNQFEGTKHYLIYSFQNQYFSEQFYVQRDDKHKSQYIYGYVESVAMGKIITHG